ncbi:MAG TPA: response regulator transcription factor [Bacteroidales bacterium]|nr:response regulator transcription factor [Bacteroidales bacterium]
MNILLGDDHLMVRAGVEQIIRTLPEVVLIEEVNDGYELLSKVDSHQYDLVIMDISISGISGLDVLQKMRHNKNMTNVLLYSFDPHKQQAMFALRQGASGYLAKNSVFEELATAIRRISKGGKYVSAETA